MALHLLSLEQKPGMFLESNAQPARKAEGPIATFCLKGGSLYVSNIWSSTASHRAGFNFV
jgi:hypothetical protein